MSGKKLTMYRVAVNAPQPNSVLTVAEVAAQLRVSRMTVYRLCADGELPSWRVRRSIRVPADGLDRYMRARLAGASGVNP
jgi:excisionase family DNA binding protein